MNVITLVQQQQPAVAKKHGVLQGHMHTLPMHVSKSLMLMLLPSLCGCRRRLTVQVTRRPA
jgi:hypothetical protein